MNVAVIGSRSFKNFELLKNTLSKIEISLIISGGADGADSLAERYAREQSIPTKIFLPDWKKYGKSAGMIRNTDIINEADIVVAFWDKSSKGTKDSIDKANKLDKKLILVTFEN